MGGCCWGMCLSSVIHKVCPNHVDMVLDFALDMQLRAWLLLLHVS